MAGEAFRSGITDVICTPHLRDPGEDTAVRARPAMEALRRALDQEGIGLRLHPGFELTFPFLVATRGEDLGPYTLGYGTSYVLVEVPHEGWPPFAGEQLADLVEREYIPVLAHPERNERIQRDPELLHSLLRTGAVAQGTVASLVGHFGKRSRQTLLRLMAEGAISLIGTDAHFRRAGAWDFEAAKALRDPGDEGVGLLTTLNPRLLLEARPLLPGPRVPYGGGPMASLRRLFG
jgi:protein-tyrosine phosphatase